jgi:starch-binding outer membrane protein, SusD/RagB family
MKITKYSFILIAIALLGCADKLDIQPLNTVGSTQALSTSGDVEALLVGAYTAMGDNDVYGGNLLRDADLLGDDGEITWDGTFVDPGEIWAKKMLKTNGQAQETWINAYITINDANIVLANLDKVTADKKNRVEGEAKFLRGTMYFELARTYGKTWVDGSPAQNLAVPLVLAPSDANSISAKIKRNTVAEVYTQVIGDLQAAETLLPTKNGIFANTYSASAILSRVFLMQNKYPEAVTAANKVIASGLFSLTLSFADAFAKTSTALSGRTSIFFATPEDVFAVQVTSQAGINSLNTFYDPTGRGDIPVEDFHLTLYETGDARKAFFQTSGGVRYTRKYTNRFANISVVRLAELYLTRAEGNLRAGTTVGATPLADVNRIRARVGLGNLTTVVLADVLKERKLELAFEGHLIHDIKRTQGSVGALPFSSPNLIYPIPQRETILNSALVQNEGY